MRAFGIVEDRAQASMSAWRLVPEPEMRTVTSKVLAPVNLRL